MVLREQAPKGLKLQVATQSRSRRKGMAASADADGLAGLLHNQRLPELRFEMRDPRSLRAPDLNVKKVSPAQVARVGQAIRQLDYVHPVLITVQGEIIDGVSSVEAAIRLGLREVPVIIAGHMDAQAILLARMTLNALPARAEWDLDNLKTSFTILLEADVCIDIAFDPQQADAIIHLDQDRISKRDNQALERGAVNGQAIAAGSLWTLGPHRLIQGDACDPTVHERLLDEMRVRLVLTDVPYNVGADIVAGLRSDRQGAFVMGAGEMSHEAFIAFLAQALGASAEHLCNGGLLYSFIDWRHITHLVEAAAAVGLSQIALAVWVKSQAGMGSLYRSQHELVGIFKKGVDPHINNVELGRHGRDRSNVWRYPGANTVGSSARAALADHPTPKCVEMLADAIADVTAPGDAVLDPFMGGGATLVAAHKTGRTAYGVEIDPRYVEVTLRRWRTLTGQPAILKETGETFDEVVARHAAGAAPAACEPQEGQPRPRVRVPAGGTRSFTQPNLTTAVIRAAKTKVKMTVNGVTKTRTALEAQVETTQLRGLKGEPRFADTMMGLYEKHLPAPEDPGPRVLSEEARKLLTNHVALMKLIEEATGPDKPKDQEEPPS